MLNRITSLLPLSACKNITNHTIDISVDYFYINRDERSFFTDNTLDRVFDAIISGADYCTITHNDFKQLTTYLI